MAGELERFLQQAAERLADKVGQQQPQNRPRPAQPPRPRRQAERAPLHPDVVDAEIVEAEIVADHTRRELGPDPLSNLDTRPALAQQISLADEKMAEHIHDVLDHDIGRLTGPDGAMQREQGQSSHSQHDAQNTSSEVASQVSRRKQQVSPLVDMLRQPESLRAAFIASQIFTRKF